MAIPAAIADVPVKLNNRCADVCVVRDGLRFTFKGHESVFITSKDISRIVLSSDRAGVCMTCPHVIVPGTKKPVISIVLTPGKGPWDVLVHQLRDIRLTVDACAVPHLVTACDRTSVQILPDRSIYVWTARNCKCVVDPYMAVLQRTKGGMSTYDVHLLHNGSNEVTTIEMLPHDVLDQWATALGIDKVYDAGPDPICPLALSRLCKLGDWDKVLEVLREEDDMMPSSDECSNFSQDSSSEDESISGMGSERESDEEPEAESSESDASSEEESSAPYEQLEADSSDCTEVD